MKNLSSHHPPRKIFLVPVKGVLKWLRCEKNSVKNLCPYHPPSKNFLVPVKGVLKWLSCEKKFPVNLRPFPLENCFACRQRNAKKIEWRNFFMKNLSSYHPRSKKISRADKGGLKMAELRKKILC